MIVLRLEHVHRGWLLALVSPAPFRSDGSILLTGVGNQFQNLSRVIGDWSSIIPARMRLLDIVSTCIASYLSKNAVVIAHDDGGAFQWFPAMITVM